MVEDPPIILFYLTLYTSKYGELNYYPDMIAFQSLSRYRCDSEFRDIISLCVLYRMLLPLRLITPDNATAS